MRIRRLRFFLFDETGLSREKIFTLKLIILAIAFGTVCFNITGGVAMAGYLKFLGASDFTYGIILAVGPFTTLLQVFVSYLLERTRKRKLIFMIAGILQRTAWLPFGITPIILPMAGITLRIWMVLLFFMISACSTPFVNVSFFSFIADIVPGNIRGRYFGVRQRIAIIFGIAGGLATAFLLDRHAGFHGYALVFSIASVFGVVDILTFIFIKIPPMGEHRKTSSLPKMLAEVFTNKRYMAIIGFVTIWSFSVQIAGPFYMVYAKTVLDLSNTVITLIMQILPSVCMVIILPTWGRVYDKYGNRPVMILSTCLSSIAPFLWFLIVPGPYAVVPMFFTAISGGLLSVGLDFGAQNVFLLQTPDENRSMFVAIYFSITSLFGIALANMAGGWLLDNALSVLEGMRISFFGLTPNRYNYLFLISVSLRVISSYVLLPRMIEGDGPNSPFKVLMNMTASQRKR